MATKNRDYGKRITITHVNEKVHDELTNIARNMGVDRSDLLKPHLREILSKYPDNMKVPPREY